MARITVEDCLSNVKNRFHLVELASERARQLRLGTDRPRVESKNDKMTVLALREIAAGHTDFNQTVELSAEEEALVGMLTLTEEELAEADLSDQGDSEEGRLEDDTDLAMESDADAEDLGKDSDQRSDEAAGAADGEAS